MAKLQTFEKEITVKLTEAEMEQRRVRIVDALGELESAEAEKRAELADLNGAIKAKKQELRNLRVAATTGQESRLVQCFEERDEKRGHVLTIRVDTNETVDERAMTAEERQGALFGEEQGESTPAASAPGLYERARAAGRSLAEQRAVEKAAAATEKHADKLVADAKAKKATRGKGSKRGAGAKLNGKARGADAR